MKEPTGTGCDLRRIRRWKKFQKLTEQAEAWEERRKLAISAREAQRNQVTQGIYASQTQKVSNVS